MRVVSKNGATALKISALTEGTWGDKLSVVIDNSADGETGNNFKLVVNYDGTPVETFEPVTWNASPTLADTSATPAEYVRSAINCRSEFIAHHRRYHGPSGEHRRHAVGAHRRGGRYRANRGDLHWVGRCR